MWKNKKLVILLIIFFGISLFLQIWKYFNPKKTPSEVIPEEIIVSPTAEVQKEFPISGKVFQMPTKDGNSLELKNPLENNELKIDENSALIKETKDYNIEFQNLSEGPLYFILIKNENVQLARALAEKDLLNYLGITQAEICRIKVLVGVPLLTNEKAAGSYYGLSFCPDGQPFPADWNE